jgi:hypothetical protein
VSGAELRSRLGLKSTLVQFSREPLTALLPGSGRPPFPQLAVGDPRSTAGSTPSLVPSPSGAGLVAGAGTPGLGTPAAALASSSPAVPGAAPAASPYGPGTATASAPLLVPPLPASAARAALPRFQRVGHRPWLWPWHRHEPVGGLRHGQARRGLRADPAALLPGHPAEALRQPGGPGPGAANHALVRASLWG